MAWWIKRWKIVAEKKQEGSLQNKKSWKLNYKESKKVGNDAVEKQLSLNQAEK